MEDEKIFEKIVNSQFLRILIVGFLTLLLQIPMWMIQNLVIERQTVRQEAVSNITKQWGQSQTVIGPRLVIPYIKRMKIGDTVRADVHNAAFLPEELNISSQIESEVRYRGIFEVPVYKSKIELKGKYSKPDFSNWGVQPEDILWDRAEVNVAIADAKAIQNQAVMTWNERQIPFAPGSGKLGGNRSGIHVLLKGQMEGNAYNFTIPLVLNGSENLNFVPFGKFTTATIQSNWKNPSFQGELPDQREINDKGFSAKWEIPSLGRNYAQQWNSESPVADETIQQSLFGVDLISPVDHYSMTDRSLKYNFLFVLLTFVALWLFELTAQVRVHPLQYLLIGVAMCLFYVMQLAISEHLGFHWAYAIASFGVVSLITLYSMGVLGMKRRGGIVGIMQVALYSYLYVVLANQDYALLIGSLGLFAFLAIVMSLTRGLNAPRVTN
ncbi:MAG: cell envelope integrity protein CreD [Synechococcales bacterium]|nr:cell envelope integrity protein CreD [Synechococcales bacterium]